MSAPRCCDDAVPSMTVGEHLKWAGVLLALLVLFLASYAFGHDADTGWTYPPECCGNGDCVMVHDASRIRTVKGGYLIDGHYFIAHRDTRLSPDGQWHVCIYGGKLYCLFRPDQGS